MMGWRGEAEANAGAGSPCRGTIPAGRVSHRPRPAHERRLKHRGVIGLRQLGLRARQRVRVLANIGAIRSFSNSLIKFLESSYPEDLALETRPLFRLLSSGELAEEAPGADPSITLFLYRVTVDDHLRNTHSRRSPGLISPLPLNLHYLLTVWSNSAEVEHVLLAWAMRHLHEHPILDVSSLTPDGGWAADEVIHIAPEELSNEDLQRLWESVTPSYRLSYSYVARVVQLEPSSLPSVRPVIATRSTLLPLGGGPIG
jgi:hypothetical protein